MPKVTTTDQRIGRNMEKLFSDHPSSGPKVLGIDLNSLSPKACWIITKKTKSKQIVFVPILEPIPNQMIHVKLRNPQF